jgi:hypothetical protein
MSLNCIFIQIFHPNFSSKFFSLKIINMSQPLPVELWMQIIEYTIPRSPIPAVRSKMRPLYAVIAPLLLVDKTINMLCKEALRRQERICQVKIQQHALTTWGTTYCAEGHEKWDRRKSLCISTLKNSYMRYCRHFQIELHITNNMFSTSGLLVVLGMVRRLLLALDRSALRPDSNFD